MSIKFKNIAKKSMFRKPNMIEDISESEKDDDVKSEDIQKAIRKAEISKFKEKLEQREKEVEEYERKKQLTQSMSILERRMDTDINKEIISFSLEMQILECLRVIKGKGKKKE